MANRSTASPADASDVSPQALPDRLAAALQISDSEVSEQRTVGFYNDFNELLGFPSFAVFLFRNPAALAAAQTAAAADTPPISIIRTQVKHLNQICVFRHTRAQRSPEAISSHKPPVVFFSLA